jgi:hypothetical protein
MNCSVKSIPTFDRQAKRLAKKYPSLKLDLANLINELFRQASGKRVF